MVQLNAVRTIVVEEPRVLVPAARPVAVVHAPRVIKPIEPEGIPGWAWVGAATAGLAFAQSRGLLGGLLGTASPLAIAGVGGAATVASAALEPPKPGPGRPSATAALPPNIRPIVDEGLAAAETALTRLAADTSSHVRSMTVAELAALGRVAIEWGPMSWDELAPHAREFRELADGPDTLDARVRVMQIAMAGVSFGVGIPHDAGRTDWKITNQNVERAVLTAFAVVNWWTSPATYWRPDRARVWSTDVLRIAGNLIANPHCSLELDGYSMDERYAALGTAGCGVRQEAYARWIADAINEWRTRRGLPSVPGRTYHYWHLQFPGLGTKDDQYDLIATLAPVLSGIAMDKVTVWFSRVPSAWDQWETGEIIAAVIGGIVGAVAIAAAAAGAAAGAAAAIAAAAGAAAAGAGVVGSAVSAVTGAITAAGAALGLTPAMTAAIVGVAVPAITGGIVEAAG